MTFNQQLAHNLTLELIKAYKRIYNFSTIKVLAKDSTVNLLRKKNEIPHSQSSKPVKHPGYKIPIKKEKYNLNTIRSILKDPIVFSLECPGENRPIIINRSGIITISNVILSKDEIDTMMKEISEKTRIPMQKGVFKALFEDFLVIAVLSDYIGTRFVIQKRQKGQ